MRHKKQSEKVQNCGLTVEKAVSDFLKNIERKTKESTFARYSFISERHIIPYFTGIHLDNVDNETVNDFIRYKIEKGSLDERPMSPKTVNDIVSLLMQIIKNSCQLDLNVDKPSYRQKDISIFTEAEYNQFKAYILTCIDNKKLGIIIAMLTGIRIGELCALKWEDVNLEDGIISIDKTIQRVKNTNGSEARKTKIIIDTPKSSTSVRMIPVPSILLQKLKEFKSLDDDYILTNTEKFIEPRVYQRHFKSYLRDCKIKERKFHTIRHTFATMAVSRGMDIKTLSLLLGHSDVGFTMKRYVHPNIEHKKIQIEKLAVGF